MPFWLENGGTETLASYRTSPEDPAPWEAIPREHLGLLRGCSLRWAAGDYLFVHAGVRPGVPLDRQDPFDLIWIRVPSCPSRATWRRSSCRPSPAAAPSMRPHRIGIDTGACFGGDLTCLVLEGQRLRFLTGLKRLVARRAGGRPD